MQVGRRRGVDANLWGVTRIVHAADLHIDSPMRGLRRHEGAREDLLRSATRNAFLGLVKACIDTKADLLVLAGDLFDGNWNDNGSGEFFLREMSKLAESGTKVVYARGNHDAESEITRRMRIPKGVYELPTAAVGEFRFADIGVRVVGRGFPEREVRDDYVRQFPVRDGADFHLGLLHTNVGGSAEHGNYAPSDLHSLQGLGYDYMALGHIHAHAVLSDAPWVVYPGNLQGRHVRETGPKGAVQFEVKNGRVQNFERLIVDVARWTRLDVDVGECAVIDDVHEAIETALRRASMEAEGRPLAARVMLRGETALHERLQASTEALGSEARAAAVRLRGAGTWVESVRVHTTIPRARDAHARGALDNELRTLLASDEFGKDLKAEFASLRKALPAPWPQRLDELLDTGAADGAELLRALLAGEKLL